MSILNQSPLVLACAISIAALAIPWLLDLSQQAFWLVSYLCWVTWGYLTITQRQFRTQTNQNESIEKKSAENEELHQRLKIRSSDLQEHMHRLLQDTLQPLQNDVTRMKEILSEKDLLIEELNRQRIDLQCALEQLNAELQRQQVEDDPPSDPLGSRPTLKAKHFALELKDNNYEEAPIPEDTAVEKNRSKIELADAEKRRRSMATMLEEANQRENDLKTQLEKANRELVSKNMLIEDVQKDFDLRTQQLYRESEVSRRKALAEQKAIEEKANSMVHDSIAKADELQEKLTIISDEYKLRQQQFATVQFDSEQTIRRLERELDCCTKESAILLESIISEATLLLSEASNAGVNLQSQNSSLRQIFVLMQKGLGDVATKSIVPGGVNTLSYNEKEFLFSAIEQFNKMPDTSFRPLDEGQLRVRMTSAFEAIKTAYKTTSDTNSFVSKKAEELMHFFEAELQKIAGIHGRDEKSQYHQQHAANHFLADLQELLFQKVDPRNIAFCKDIFLDAVGLVKKSGILVTDYQVASAISDLECEHENEKRVEEMREEKRRKQHDQISNGS